MKVYRLEHRTYGAAITPYSFRDYDLEEYLQDNDPLVYEELNTLMNQVNELHADYDRPSVTYEFSICFTRGQHFAACPSYHKLRTWFKGIYKELIDSGFVIVKYEVPESEVIYGDIQCIFPMNQATRIN